MKRDLLTLADLSAPEIDALMARSARLKRARLEGHRPAAGPLGGKVLGMIFEKASTRTRVSFEVGMYELGGHAVYLAPEGSQIGRGEPIADTARVLGGYCHAVIIRTFAQARAEELARWSPIPVINALTDHSHPCQVLADLFTVWELFGQGPERMRGLGYAWIGDGNNMAHSWIRAAGRLGLDLVLACPEGYDPDPAVMLEGAAMARESGAKIRIVRDPREATRGRDVLSTDVWASMGQEDESERRRKAFAGYCLDSGLLATASPQAIVLHCLPAHRGEEITHEVLEGPQSAVFRQAENRLHVQKAILELLIAGSPSPGSHGQGG
ncbi:MAG: ornithine carbamoyltransferase [Deltaproteobacteria bacterium]|nr:ornithine carbamoyltransferase [Deltaproteobacteria bacterium]